MGDLPPRPTAVPLDLTGFEEVSPFGGDCHHRPPSSVCVRFSDGYVFLMRDGHVGWAEGVLEDGRAVEIAVGARAEVQHVRGTRLLRLVKR